MTMDSITIITVLGLAVLLALAFWAWGYAAGRQSENARNRKLWRNVQRDYTRSSTRLF